MESMRWTFSKGMKLQVVSFVLLLSFPMLDGVKSDCNYFEELKVGIKYYAYNPNYTESYQGENHCTWRTSSAYTVTVNCTINMTKSKGCTQDSISINSVGNDTHKYCGSGTFVYEGKNVTINFDSSYYTEGGKFLCEMRTEKSFNEDNCKCGRKKVTKIVGGDETGVNEFPMMAGLVDSTRREVYCGATIISHTYVVTAAHCLEKRNITNIGVLVGEHDVTTGDETNATRLYRVETCIIHPGYDNENNINDIAICKINDTIQYSNAVGPACLPFQRSCYSFGGDHVQVLGWGLTDFGGAKSDTLQKAELNVISNKECNETYPYVTSDQLCTYAQGKDSCQMDSGGPVLWQDPTTHNLVLVGITSSGIGCASGIPAVSTRVGGYLPWIESVTPGEQYCKVE